LGYFDRVQPIVTEMGEVLQRKPSLDVTARLDKWPGLGTVDNR
jgi:hypothetical protein